ncbi:hypothetical protein MKW98_017133 [Papaver atlanticum]|uniref:SnoaL-like domain-containing protein n=1 Tax=Papaver atlanticum TaxID=357466 RepID=A0AAD4THU4_9MAGN|nr:hypothetical protein MKW98_017133 [Papaver atlanticum]
MVQCVSLFPSTSVTSPSLLHNSRNLSSNFSSILKIEEPLRKRGSKTLITFLSSSSQNSTAVQKNEEEKGSMAPASDIVRKFYDGINRHDLASVEGHIAENCVYEDLVFPQPFVGRKAILDFFKKFTDSISKDLQFVIDDISNEDSLAVGVTWHLAWQGKPFPFSKGCSFYRLEVVNGKKQIIYGRDSVEPFIKPGESALVAIKGVTWLFQRFPQLADKL